MHSELKLGGRLQFVSQFDARFALHFQISRISYRSLVHKMKTQWGGRANRGYTGRNFISLPGPARAALGPNPKFPVRRVTLAP
jgi:hypothetical protein